MWCVVSQQREALSALKPGSRSSGRFVAVPPARRHWCRVLLMTSHLHRATDRAMETSASLTDSRRDKGTSAVPRRRALQFEVQQWCEAQNCSALRPPLYTHTHTVGHRDLEAFRWWGGGEVRADRWSPKQVLGAERKPPTFCFIFWERERSLGGAIFF